MNGRALIPLALVAMLATPAAAAEEIEYAAEKVVQYALENVVSGTPVTEIVRGVEVSVRPLKTWKSVSGFYCRRYEISVRAPGAEERHAEQTRCRDRDAIWKLVREK